MLTLLFLAFHSSRVMEILVMVVAAVIIFQEILGCTSRQKQSSKRLNPALSGKPESLQKKSKKEKERELNPKTAMPISQQPTCQTQPDSLLVKAVKEAEVKTGITAKTEETKEDKNSKYKRDMSGKRLLSNPIVTPVTDEFPTEEKEESKNEKREEEGKEKDKKDQKTGAVGLTPVRSEEHVNYAVKKNKKGAERNISDPIVTPVSDEFPTVEEQKSVKKNDGKAGKDEKAKKEAHK